jgi:predicted RNase H-like HicB family nuclease
VFVARATELPSVVAHDDTREQAMAELKSVLSMVMENVKDSDKSIPKPF